MNGKSLSQIGTVTEYSCSILPKIGDLIRLEFALVLCGGGYILFLGNAGLPVAHYHSDGTAIRDTGTMLNYLFSQPNPVMSVLKAILAHVEGPLQYVLLNAYCFLIGDLLPLTPSTMQFPNSIFAFFAAMFIWLIGLHLVSRRAAFYCAAVFVVGPWLATTIRLPWYFNTLSCALHCSTVYFCLRYALDPKDKFYGTATLLSLGLYTLTGMDWPFFGAFLLTFLILSSVRSEQPLVRGLFLGNRLGLFPFACAVMLLIISIYWWGKHGPEGFEWSRLGHPFCVFMNCIKANNLSRVLNNTLLQWGPQMLLAFVGIFGFYRGAGGRKSSSNQIQATLVDSMCLWLTVAAVAVIASSGDPTYLYVLALPSAMLSGLTLSRMRYSYAVPILVLMAFFQIYVVSNGRFSFSSDKKERILAAACFLIEQRPDLISGQGKPFISEGDALPIISYMRAGTRSTLVRLWCSGDDPPSSCSDRRSLIASLKRFCGDDQEIQNPWFILDTQILAEETSVCNFWLTMVEHPEVRWIARFRDGDQREIAIGELRKDAGVPLSHAPFMNVRSLAAAYLEKYDRISFLKNNVEFLNHY